MTKYVLTEGSCMIPNKAAYMDDKTWVKEVKVVVPGIRKMEVRNVAFVCFILFSTYLTIDLCSSKLSVDDLLLPKVVGIPHILWIRVSHQFH